MKWNNPQRVGAPTTTISKTIMVWNALVRGFSTHQNSAKLLTHPSSYVNIVTEIWLSPFLIFFLNCHSLVISLLWIFISICHAFIMSYFRNVLLSIQIRLESYAINNKQGTIHILYFLLVASYVRVSILRRINICATYIFVNIYTFVNKIGCIECLLIW